MEVKEKVKIREKEITRILGAHVGGWTSVSNRPGSMPGCP
jgi:hypothetical protein